MILNQKEKLIFVGIIILFILIRFFGLDMPYHLDEAKYASIKPIIWNSEGVSAHPPLTSIIFGLTSKIFGPDYFRATPLIFGFINLFLIFFLVKSLFDTKAALWSAFLFSISFYSVLASLTVDTDGQILPFFLLLTFIGYFKWEKTDDRKRKLFWAIFTLAAIIAGFLTKLSFIIPVAAVFLTFLYNKRALINKSFIIKYGLYVIGILVLMFLALLNAKIIYPTFDLSKIISHAQSAIKFSDRSYLQVFIQIVKAIFYSSPLLFVPILFLRKHNFSRIIFSFLLILLGSIFYIFLFDFSRAALDKYLQFIIVPLCVISGVVIADISSERRFNNNSLIFTGIFVAVFLFFTQFLPHFIPPHYPKEEWIKRVLDLRWNFVFPFTGGSGPMGFYVSWLFIGGMWIAAVSIACAGFFQKKSAGSAMVAILFLGVVYNTVFAEEYLFGKINGSSKFLTKNAISFIKENNEIEKVITYNDIGSRDLRLMGKYQRRLYAVPKYEEEYKEILDSFKIHYFVLGIPHINSDSLYGEYFSTCAVVYEKISRKISSRIYDCKNATIPD
ncbi:MAG: hypothetical protein A2655_02040 [Candidatus Yanofskybacteria bacterium RIFCSPHIGHO2_01_FULL_43_42]|uniref:Glycosyltransferase RgtA/B/C/D-like domain-containing protein n=1 Tax=Candidatus Yanofskybacteria bacterium RIFCSPLOWO2_01_FULL_43_22 TaxID=1802695 RepID=A0A1F8GGY5_9BACT|nr:MAG: hypothetical protein A2655_02040 [Candidatus Yanofskybacteria bacterium RIFCSPHIGHO2_01_FULL_43_42]OGN13250.1 MAG: hypothetical protein A3D48_02945 [Candidatus Yanofskybacteria bacterium RIFCSPHIGHO2_02_FULL_43_17]OGN24665.1 MAG: hypothetical protein A3A13_01170 [Candidatus Yanofskybacteria bacterium RIFCSPLOWO2_01_FULL_43_22]